MAKIFGFLGKKETGNAAQMESRKMFVKSFPIHEEDDAEEVIEYLRLGTTIALLKVKKPMRAFEAIRRIKEACIELNGEVVGLAPNIFMAVPEKVEIVKRQPNEIFMKQAAEEAIREEEAEAEKEVQKIGNVESLHDEGWEDISLGEKIKNDLSSDYFEAK